MEGFGVIALHDRARAATRMPDGNYLQPVAPDSVVNPVAYAIDMEAPHAGRTGVRYYGTETRLFDKKGQSGLKVRTHRAGRRCGPICCPPLRDALDLSRRTPGDVKLKRHGLPVATQMLKQLFAGDGFAAVSLSKACFELRELCRRQLRGSPGLVGEDVYVGPFR